MFNIICGLIGKSFFNGFNPVPMYIVCGAKDIMGIDFEKNLLQFIGQIEQNVS
ncbi:MAG: hypothetical protein ABI045_06975 [Flavobacteriales bacterium]